MGNKYWKLFLNKQIRHVIRQLPADNQINKQLHQLRKLDFQNFFVLAKRDRITKVLKNVDNEYFKSYFLWIVVTLEYDGNDNFIQRSNYSYIVPKCRNGRLVNGAFNVN